MRTECDGCLRKLPENHIVREDLHICNDCAGFDDRETAGGKKFSVYWNGKPASHEGFPYLKRGDTEGLWSNNTFDSFLAAREYANAWCGRNLRIAADQEVSTEEGIIEIRSEQNEKETNQG